MTPKPTKPNDEGMRKQIETIVWFFEDDYAAGEREWKDKQVDETVDKIMALITKREHLAELRNEEELRFYRNLDIETGGLQPRKVKASYLWANYQQQLEEAGSE